MRLVRDSGRVLNGALQIVGAGQKGRYSGRQTNAVCATERKSFCLPGCGEDHGQICFSSSSVLRFFLMCVTNVEIPAEFSIFKK